MAKDLGEHKFAESAKESARKASCTDFVAGLCVSPMLRMPHKDTIT